MKILDISFYGTEDILADMFTKLLPHPKVEHLLKLAGWKPTVAGNTGWNQYLNKTKRI
jgi:hypothetical protein